MPNPPPAKPLLLSLLIERLRLDVPQWAVVLAILTPGGAWMALGDSRTSSPTGPVPAPVPQVPLLSTTPAALSHVPQMWVSALPRPGPNQLRAGKCDKRAAHVELNGGCWIKTETPRPCPEGIQWEHDGKCWLPVAEARPVPTTGEPRAAPVAGQE